MDPKEKKDKKTLKIKLKSLFIFLGADADKDWKIIAVIMSSILIVITIINAFLFFHYTILSDKKSLEESKFELIDRQKLIEVIERFDRRTEEFKKLKDSISVK